MPRYRFVILISVCCLAFVGNFIQYQVSAIALDIMLMLGVNSVGFSLMFLIPMLAAVLFGIPLGIAGDVFGPRRVVLCGFLIACVGGLVRLFTLDSLAWQLISLFLIGIGMAACATNVVKIIAIWFQSKANAAIGFYYSVSCLGIVVSQLVGRLYSSVFQAYFIAELALVGVTLLWLATGRDLPCRAKSPSPKTALATFAIPAKNPAIWLISLAVGLILSSSTAFVGLLPQALESGKGIEGLTAGGMAASVTVASIFGCLAGPALLARVKRSGRRARLFLGAVNLTAGFLMLVTWSAPHGMPLWIVLIAGGFLSAMAGPVLQSLPVSIDAIGSRYAGSASGIINTVSLAMSFALPIVVSAIAHESYAINLLMESVCFMLSALPLMALSKLDA